MVRSSGNAGRCRFAVAHGTSAVTLQLVGEDAAAPSAQAEHLCVRDATPWQLQPAPRHYGRGARSVTVLASLSTGAGLHQHRTCSAGGECVPSHTAPNVLGPIFNAHAAVRATTACSPATPWQQSGTWQPALIAGQRKAAASASPAPTLKHPTPAVLQEEALQQEDGKQQQRKMPRQERWRAAKLLFAGAMSAVVSRTAVAPLERVKMEMVLKQGAGTAVSTASQIMRTEGIAGFWKGNALNLLRTAPFKATNFATFELLHTALTRLTGNTDGNAERFTAGALAGVTATLVCFPLDVVRTRLMSHARGPSYGAGPFRTLWGMLHHEGVGALYTGCWPAVIAMAPGGATYYGVYDWLKSKHGGPLATQYTLLYGALAGVASELIVYPLEVVRRRMQMQQLAMAAVAHHGRGAAVARGVAAVALSGGSWGRVAATCRAIMKAEGLAGFYAGIAPNMLQVLPSSALSYWAFDTVKSALLPSECALHAPVVVAAVAEGGAGTTSGAGDTGEAASSGASGPAGSGAGAGAGGVVQAASAGRGGQGAPRVTD